METDERFILENKIGKEYFWYICELEYYDNPNSSWILGCTQTRKRKDAMQFFEKKAKILAEVLSSQEDEEGYSAQWKVVKL